MKDFVTNDSLFASGPMYCLVKTCDSQFCQGTVKKPTARSTNSTTNREASEKNWTLHRNRSTCSELDSPVSTARYDQCYWPETPWSLQKTFWQRQRVGEKVGKVMSLPANHQPLPLSEWRWPGCHVAVLSFPQITRPISAVDAEKNRRGEECRWNRLASVGCSPG